MEISLSSGVDEENSLSATLGPTPIGHSIAVDPVESLLSLTSSEIFDPLLAASLDDVFCFPHDTFEVSLAIDRIAEQFSQLPLVLRRAFPILGLKFDYVTSEECPVLLPLSNEEDLLFKEDDGSSFLEAAPYTALSVLGTSNNLDSGSSVDQYGGAGAEDLNVVIGQRPSTWPGDVIRMGDMEFLPTSDIDEDDEIRVGSKETCGETEVALQGKKPRQLDTDELDDPKQAYGVKFAAQALNKLKLPDSITNLPSHIASLISHEGLESLEREKRRIKLVLRRHDALFERQFGTLPSRTEKEPMRALYMYYRKIKLAISDGGVNLSAPVCCDNLQSLSLQRQSSNTSNSSACSSSRPLAEIKRKL